MVGGSHDDDPKYEEPNMLRSCLAWLCDALLGMEYANDDDEILISWEPHQKEKLAYMFKVVQCLQDTSIAGHALEYHTKYVWGCQKVFLET